MKLRSAIKTDLFAFEHHRKKIDSVGDPLRALPQIGARSKHPRSDHGRRQLEQNARQEPVRLQVAGGHRQEAQVHPHDRDRHGPQRPGAGKLCDNDDGGLLQARS